MKSITDENALKLKSSALTAFLGSKVTKGICYALIVGQLGLLARAANAVVVYSDNQSERALKAKSLGNSKGY